MCLDRGSVFHVGPQIGQVVAVPREKGDSVNLPRRWEQFTLSPFFALYPPSSGIRLVSESATSYSPSRHLVPPDSGKLSLTDFMTRRFAIRSLLVLALAFLAPQVVRADMVTYNMTGTIWNLVNVGNLPVHVGDRIGWTLQYDRSLAPNSGISNPYSSIVGYSSPVPPLSNFVDLTTHTALNSPPNGPPPWNFGYPSYVLTLMTNLGPQFVASEAWFSSEGRYSFASFSLENNQGTLPAHDLAHLQLKGIPFAIRSLQYGYEQATSSAPELEFFVKADPLSSTPEPGSLLLSIVGAIGLIAGRVRSRRT